MNLQYIITSQAEKQIFDALVWYENISIALGSKFEDEIKEKLYQIIENPLKFKVRYKDFRVAHLKKFPYSIYYTSNYELVLIYAIFHQHMSVKRKKL